ncbi:type II toxin-antitoxin system RelE/ParE family toxin [Reichenbachiella sp. MALMAid0571]|uniref:type II toxin-antitoxin system RelE/ParE family toxin n=1 Tax=Reichenbachiella sp. MALMAid0571 TaxID=3143939 RepID=UPI0032DEE9A6
MVEIILAESAWNDLDSITDYIAQDSPRYAKELSNRILSKIEQLKGFPNSGRKVPEFNNELLRELILGNYRIVYRIFQPTKIVILRIVHGSKLLN